MVVSVRRVSTLFRSLSIVIAAITVGRTSLRHPGPTGGPVDIVLQPYAGTGLRTVMVTLGDSSTSFIFDTGAGFTVITPDEAAAADCTPFGRLVGFRADGQQIALPRCGPARLRIEDSDAVGEVGVFDLKALLGQGAPPSAVSSASCRSGIGRSPWISRMTASPSKRPEA